MNSHPILQKSFYERHTLEVAKDLLGKILVVRTNPKFPLEHPKAGIAAGRIVETEAYRGDDPASHSCRGETPRSSVMFGEPGVAYVYFIYGMYEMLNFVTEPKGNPGAVLIRALEPLHNIELMMKRRTGAAKHSLKNLTNGPGRLCRALGIQMSDYGESLLGPRLFVMDDGFKPDNISTSGRIGITTGIEKPWRYFITDNRYVSKKLTIKSKCL